MNNVTTFDNFPPFATNGSRNMNTESAKYQVGFLEGETFPAEWANYLFHGATKGISDLNTAVQSIWKENINVIQGSGQTPSSSDNTQLKTAIELMIQNAVLTANAQVLAQAKLDAHPVHSLYWSSDPTDPSILFGGTWTRIKDRFVLATGDTYGNGATGGSATVKLTESNLPAHTHRFSWSGTTSEVNTNHTHTMSHTHTRGTMEILGAVVFPDCGTGSYIESADGAFLGVTEYSNIIVPSTTVKHSSFKALRFHASEGWRGKTSEPSNENTGFCNKENSSISHSHTYSGSGTTENGKGTSTAFSVLPPYIVKYCWERTA